MTSSSDAPPAPVGLRQRLPAAAAARASGVRTSASAALPIRVVDRVPPPPLPPRVDSAALVRALEAGFAAVRNQVDHAFAEIQKECVELALAAAEHVTRRTAERGELDLERPLAEMLAARRRELAEAPALLRVHPEDGKALAPKLAEITPAGARVELAPDPAVARGQLVLELGASRLVRTLEQEMKRLRSRLLAGGAA
jgi:flagellar biosynthesis/type III secretory pathway protein FliH